MFWRAALVVLAAGAALMPVFPPAMVERVYSKGAYAIVQPVLTTVSNLTRFAMLDGLVIALAALWLVQAARDIVSRQPISRKLIAIVSRTAVWCAALYLCFL